MTGLLRYARNDFIARAAGPWQSRDPLDKGGGAKRRGIWVLTSPLGCRVRGLELGAFGEDCLSSQGEFRSRPIQVLDRGLPRRGSTAGPPSFGYFSWRSKKSDLPSGNPRPKTLGKTESSGLEWDFTLTLALSPQGRGDKILERVTFVMPPDHPRSQTT